MLTKHEKYKRLSLDLKKRKPWWLRVLLCLDQLCNVLFFWWLSYAHEDETISSHIGREADRGNKKAIFIKKLINKIFFWQKDHCEKSIEKTF